MPPERETALRMNWDPIVLDGTDRSGRPVMFNDTGRLDLDALSKKGVAMPAVLRRHVRALLREAPPAHRAEEDRRFERQRPPFIYY